MNHASEKFVFMTVSRSKLTGENEARQRHHMKLLYCDLIAVHEKVQQVNSEVSCCWAQPEVVAHNGDKVGKVTSQVELR